MSKPIRDYYVTKSNVKIFKSPDRITGVTRNMLCIDQKEGVLNFNTVVWSSQEQISLELGSCPGTLLFNARWLPFCLLLKFSCDKHLNRVVRHMEVSSKESSNEA